MTASGRWLSIIGIGEDGLDGLSPAARRLIAQAALASELAKENGDGATGKRGRKKR